MLRKPHLRVLGGLCNNVLSQNCQMRKLLGRYVLFLDIDNFIPIHPNLENFLDSDLLSTKDPRLLLAQPKSHKQV